MSVFASINWTFSFLFANCPRFAEDVMFLPPLEPTFVLNELIFVAFLLLFDCVLDLLPDYVAFLW